MQNFKTNVKHPFVLLVRASLCCAIAATWIGCSQSGDAPSDGLIANTGNVMGAGDSELSTQDTDSQDDLDLDLTPHVPNKTDGQASDSGSTQEDESTGYIDDGESPVRDPVRVQKRQIVSKNGVLELSFDDLKFDIEVGEPFEREMLTEEIEGFDGKQIKIRGYIKPSFKQSGLKGFVFVRDDKECCFGPQAAIYDCMIVRMKKGTSTEYTVRPISIEGQLYLKEYDGPDGTIWAIFKMRNAKVN